MAHIGRNDPCPCGSGKKYKKCCLPKVQAMDSEKRLAAAGAAMDEAVGKRISEKDFERVKQDLCQVVDMYACGDAAGMTHFLESLPVKNKGVLAKIGEEYFVMREVSNNTAEMVCWLMPLGTQMIECRCRDEEDADWVEQWLESASGDLFAFVLRSDTPHQIFSHADLQAMETEQSKD